MRPDDDLGQIEVESWRALAAGSDNADSPLRYLTFCTIGLDGFPKARTLVLRAVDTKIRELEFHTDIRSAKWTELTNESKSSVIGFLPAERIQLRFEGYATLHAPGSGRHQHCWSLLSNWTRQTYCGGPPGDPSDLADGVPANTHQQEPAHRMTEPGRDVFGVACFQATSMDWTKLSRQGNRRAAFRYDGDTPEPESSWINP